jgi:hypothetical protein
MTAEDARRKVGLLRRINADNGAVAAEAETARRLQTALMARYAIKARDIPAASPTPASSLTWIYWQELLQEFGLRLDQFGYRGSASVGSKKVYIRLDKNQWWIEETLPRGRQNTARNWGVESLRKYLKEHAPRTYTFFGR